MSSSKEPIFLLTLELRKWYLQVMKRKYFTELQDWMKSKGRRPLVIRGARQVGKTWLVRKFAESQGKRLIELNFEKRPEFFSFFETNDPRQILLNLGAYFNQTLTPNDSLLFLDEIQAIPELLEKLRWFAEDLAELPVIAAGSLLEFVLEKHTFSMPVGRINYMHMEPLSFEEFLGACGKDKLLEYLISFELGTPIPKALHDQLMALFKEYIVIGGMPAVVASWITDRSLTKINQIQHDLTSTYRDDFTKYCGRIDTERLDEVMLGVPKHLGHKFVYSKINSSVQTNAVKQALDLLCKARLCHRVSSCHANGVPIGAEVNEKFIKVVFLDVGLCSAMLGLSLSQMTTIEEISLINKGGIAEQVIGQLLRTIDHPYLEPKLYYWLREEKGASAEIDYVIQHRSHIIPVEVKAGSTGSLKSLHLFMGLKKLSLAVRFNSSEPSKTDVQLKDSLGNDVSYTLLSLPFYLSGQVRRLCSSED